MKQIFYSLCLFLLMMQGAFADFIDLESINFKLINKTRITQTLFEYTYQVKITNKNTTKLKNLILLFPPDTNINFDVKITDPFIFFGELKKGEIKTSIDTFSFQYARSEPLDVSKLPNIIIYNKGVSFKDAKNNEITLFIDRYYESIPDNKGFSDIVTISENKNPTNKNLNTFPSITQNFIEFDFVKDFTVNSNYAMSLNAKYSLPLPKKLNIEVKYIENPYRVLVLRDSETEWTTFSNHQDIKIAELNVLPENNQIFFALIRSDK